MTNVVKSISGRRGPIKLETFKTDFFKQMQEVWEEKSCCDVTVVIGEEKFLCHRLILSLVSPYFKKLFYSDFKEKNSDEVTLNDLDVESFEKILNAIYTGEIDLHRHSNLYQILKTSNFLNIAAIEEVCISYILDKNYVEHITEICFLANVIGKRELLIECVNRIAADLVHFSKVEAFGNLPTDVFKLILSRASCNCKNDENTLLLALIQWNKFNQVESNVLIILLEEAKLTKISPAILANLIVSANKNNEFSEEDQKSKRLKLSNTLENINDEDEVPTLNAYVSVVDIKTGAKGIAVFKLLKEGIDWILDYFNESLLNSCILKVITVKDARYTLKHLENSDRNIFIKNRCLRFSRLKSPPRLLKRFHAVADETNIYFFSLEPLLWGILVYNCCLDEWSTISVPNDIIFTKQLTVALLDSKIYIFNVEQSADISSHLKRKYVCCFNCRTSSFSIIAGMPFMHNGAGACAYDGKIYLCGSEYENKISNRFSAFDVKTLNWYSLNQMNTNRALSHRLVYYDGFLYVVDYQPLEGLERYNIALNKWFKVPSIPSQSSYCDQVVSTGRFLDAEVAVYQFT